MGIVVLCLAAVSPSLAEDIGAKLTGQVTALLKQHDAAFSAQDVRGVMKTYITGPEIFLMGTGPGEMYRTSEGVEGAYKQFFTRFDKGSLISAYDGVSAGSHGDMAWFAAEWLVKGKVKGEAKEVKFNVSGTLLKKKGEWRLVAMHFSRLGVKPESAQEAKQ
jgi:ketosteroid isomerase-like protein